MGSTVARTSLANELPGRISRPLFWKKEHRKQMPKFNLECGMLRFLFWLALSGVALAQTASLSLRNSTVDGSEPTSTVNPSVNILPDLPPLPSGRSTEIGGTIRNVDHVRDQLTLSVFGGRDLRVLFDERTLVFRDGKRISLRELRSGERGSVETLLDGTAVFARSIHVLTRAIDGECQGQVLNFDPATGELTVRDSLSSQPMKFRVPQGTAISGDVRGGVAAANLNAGSLVKLNFQPGGGRGVVTRVTVLAAPGEQFVFSGRVTYLDISAGKLAIVDPRDQNRYDVTFDPQLAAINNVHLGNDVVVNATFDGTRYSASSIKLNSQTLP
jgi:hypothetical protein